MKFATLKKIFLSYRINFLYEKYQYPVTEAFKELLYDELNEWKNFWDLNELQIKIVFNNDEIIFLPIRKIDDLCLLGIMSLDE